MTFSPTLEAKFSQLLSSYPPGRQRAALIPMLIFAQDEVGHLSQEIIHDIATRLGITPMQVEEVIGYYSMLHKQPQGKYHVQVCTNISCLLTGGMELYDHAQRRLGLGHKERSADGHFSLEEVECIGACSWAPAIQINYDYHHHVTPAKLDELLRELGNQRSGKVQ